MRPMGQQLKGDDPFAFLSTRKRVSRRGDEQLQSNSDKKVRSYGSSGSVSGSNLGSRNISSSSSSSRNISRSNRTNDTLRRSLTSSDRKGRSTREEDPSLLSDELSSVVSTPAHHQFSLLRRRRRHSDERVDFENLSSVAESNINKNHHYSGSSASSAFVSSNATTRDPSGIGAGGNDDTDRDYLALPTRNRNECQLAFVDLPTRALASMAGVGELLNSDVDLIRRLESIMISYMERSRRCIGEEGAIYHACSDRLRFLLLQLLAACRDIEADDRESYAGNLGFVISGELTESLVLAIPSHTWIIAANSATAAARTRCQKRGAELAAAAARAVSTSTATSQSMLIRGVELRGAALVTRSTARALMHQQEVRGGEDLVEIWPLRRSSIFLSKTGDSLSFSLDTLLLSRASSVHLVMCELTKQIPFLDLRITDGLELQQVEQNNFVWLPVWCAEALVKRSAAKMILPEFLRTVQLQIFLKAEEQTKERLEPLPVYFFELARLILFNSQFHPHGTDTNGEKERGLVLQLWDRRQAKIALSFTSASFFEDMIPIDHIQPSETYAISKFWLDVLDT